MRARIMQVDARPQGEEFARGVARRRRRRHTVVGAAAAALVLLAGLAAFLLLGDDDNDDLQFVDTPTTSTTEPPNGDVVVAIRLDDLELWQLSGRFLVYGTDGISWLVDGHLEQVWDEPVVTAYTDGSGGIVFQADREDGPRLGEPMGPIHRLAPGSDEAVVLVVEGDMAVLRGLTSVDGQVDVLYTRWLPDPGTEGDARDGFPDSGMHLELFASSLSSGGERSLGKAGGFDTALRQVADTDDGLLFRTCHVECVIHRELGADLADPDDVVVGWSPTWGMGAAGDVVVTTGGSPGEHSLLAFRRLDGRIVREVRVPEVRDLSMALDPVLAPSGAEMLLVTADTERTSRVALIRGLDTDEPTIQRVLTDQALRFAPDAPTPGQGPPPIQVEAEEVELVDLEGRFLVFGSDGIAWLEDGVLDRVWTEPVDEAYPDGSGGVVFQDVGDDEWEPDSVSGAVRWLPIGATSPRQIVAAGERTTLRLVAPLEGEPSALVTRWTGPRNLDGGREWLVAVPLAGGPERVLDETGYWGDTGLDGVALTDVGLVTSVCHLQCTFRRVDSTDGDHVVQWADWSSGLAGSGHVLGFVAYLSPLGADGYPGDPVLRLIQARSQPSEIERMGERLIDVRLPHTPGVGWSWVDLAPDARSALVITPRSEAGESPRFDVVLLTGLDTSEPRVRIVRTDQALRFG